MLKIRFKRVGRKHQPAFRIVIAERRSKRDGKSIDDIGFYNPITKNFGIKKERLDYWLKNGAQITPTVFNLLVTHKILSGPKIKIKTKDKNKDKNLENSANQPELSQKPEENQTENQVNEVKEEANPENA
ncbi:MAG: 30S ribosomal protein S16 [Minisyncoccia bacterium]